MMDRRHALRPRRLAALGMAIAGWSMAAAVAAAQLPRTVTLRLDNDAFDFWLQPYDRPDQEYTSGVHISVDGGDAPWWARWRLRRLPCTTRTQECRTGGVELGQDIYSPALSADDPRPSPGSRLNAGWLYLSERARSLAPDRFDELALTLGVTGPPSLAQETQRIAHAFAPTFNRPTGWDRQIPFSLGVGARYEQRRRVAVYGDGDAIGMDVVPHMAAAVGNVATNGEVGAHVRLGWHLRHPWRPTDGPTEVVVVAGAAGRAVARDLFLDGRAAHETTGITHSPFVGRGEIALEFRRGWLTLAYRAVADTRAYAAGPRWHPWASMVGGVTFGR